MAEVLDKPERFMKRSSRAATLAGLAIVFLAAALAMNATWLCWPDALIDSGRELYVAWRLSAGDVLYRDVAVFNGPLSPYVNAAWFSLVGVGVHQLLLLNALVLAATLTLLYAGACRIAGAFGATLGGLAAVGLFVFGQALSNDSSSFMMPYSHEMTHGLLLLLLMMAGLWGYDHFGAPPGASPWRQAASLAGAAFCLGLVFLTKVELFVAGAAALAVGAGGLMLHERRGLRALLPQIALALAALALPALAAWALLAQAMPARDAWRGVLGSWLHAGNPALLKLPYFGLWMGTTGMDGGNGVPGSLATIAAWTAWYALIGLGAIALGWGLADAGARRRGAAALGAITLLAVAAVTLASKSVGPAAYLFPAAAGMTAAQMPGWLDAGRPMPVIMLVAIAAASVTGFRVSREHRRLPFDAARDRFLRREVFLLASAVLALALMAKMILLARSWHYGFVLGLPAGTLAFAFAGGAVPRILAAQPDWGGPRGAAILRAAVTLTLAMIVFAHWRTAVLPTVAEKDAWIGQGHDRFRTGPRGRVMDLALRSIAANTPPGTLGVVPEGAALNYLTRRANPTPYVFLLPSDLAMFGEDRVTAAYQAHPPDVLVALDRNTIEYGARYFGADYARPFAIWINSRYRQVGQFGAPPFTGKGFGASVFVRRD